MTREEFYKLTDILNSDVLGNFMHGGEADELIAMFEEAVVHSNILEQEEPVSEELEDAAESYAVTDEVLPNWKVIINFQVEKVFRAGANWQKQQMMKNAIPYRINDMPGQPPIVLDHYRLYEQGIRGGDKVKLIIIKEG